MEQTFLMTNENIASAISASLELGYRFLPHDRVTSIDTISEKIYFMDDLALILNRIASREGTDWFHLVKSGWQYKPFSTSRIHNKYRGQMDFVDQRSWGPYVDFQVRKIHDSSANKQYRVQVHFYQKFWSADLEGDVSATIEQKKDVKNLCGIFESIVDNGDKNLEELGS